MSGLTIEHEYLYKSASQLRDFAEKLKEDDDEILRSLATDCLAATSVHIDLLSSLSVQARANTLQAWFAVLRVRLKQRQLFESQAQVDRLSEDLAKHITTTLVPKLAAKLDAVDDRILAQGKDATRAMESLEQQLHGVNAIAKASSNTADATKSILEQIHRHIFAWEQQRERKLCLQSLYFPEIRSREDGVETARTDTFGWIFEAKSSSEGHVNRFPEWLHLTNAENNIFWIFGKPGVGKSTLMKFIARHNSLTDSIQTWSNGGELFVLRYFFWRPSSQIQRSLEGLLRSFIYQILEKYPQMVDDAFPSREWLAGGHKFRFSRDSLLEGLGRILHCIHKNGIAFFFLVDGLDEFDDRGDADEQEVPGIEELLALLRMLRSSPWAKVCVACRPLNAFIDDANNHSCFYIQHFTCEDIRKYAAETLGASEKFRSFSHADNDYPALIQEITNSAQGVFLWVKLVCRSLLNGLQNYDSISTLRKRLIGIPQNLLALYTYLLNNIDHRYREAAAQSLLFVHHQRLRRPRILDLLLLDNEFDIEHFWHSHTEDDRIVRLFQSTQTRMRARCQLLLEFLPREVFSGTDFEPGPPLGQDLNEDIYHFTQYSIGFTHRTVSEFLGNEVVNSRLQSDAGPHFSVALIKYQGSLALLRLLGLHLSSSVTFIFRSWGMVLEEALTGIGTRSESLPFGAESRLLWRTVKELIALVSLPFAQSLLEMFADAFHEESNKSIGYERSKDLDSLDLAITMVSSCLIECELEERPLHLHISPAMCPPLYTAARSDREGWLDCMNVLLDRGADPNKHYQSWTPWTVYISRLCLQITRSYYEPHRSTDKEAIRAMTSKYLLRGANPRARCIVHPMCDSLGTRRVRWAMPGFRHNIFMSVEGASVQFSAFTVLRDAEALPNDPGLLPVPSVVEEGPKDATIRLYEEFMREPYHGRFNPFSH